MPTLYAAINADKARTGAKVFVDANREMQTEAKKTNTVVHQVEISVRQVGVATERAGRQMQTASLGIASQLKTYLGLAAAIATLRNATRTIGEFQETITLAGSVSGATANQFGQLEAQARQLGATTRYTATEAAQALKQFAQSGFSVQGAMAAMPSALNLATAGQLDLAEAADVTAHAVAQFNLQASDSPHIVDILVKTANSASTNVHQLGEALTYAGTIAGAMNQNIDDVTAALGVLGNRGMQASLAGTGLRQVLVDLVNPAVDARASIESLGLSLEQVDPSRHNLIDIFRAFAQANLTAADAATIFGTRGATAAIILAQSAEQTAALSKQNKEAAGTAQELTDAMNRGLSGAVRDMVSAFEALVLQTGDDGLTGALSGVIRFTTDVVRQLAGVTVEGREVTVAVQAVADAVRLLGIYTAAWVVSNIAVKMIAFARATMQARTAMQALTLAMASNPVTLLALALGSLAAIYLSVKNSQDEAAESARRLHDEQSALARSINDTAEAIDRSARLADQRAQLQAIEQQIEAYRKLRDEIQKRDDAMRGVVIPLSQVPGVGTGAFGDEKPFFMQGEPAFKAASVIEVISKKMAEMEATAQRLRDNEAQRKATLDAVRVTSDQIADQLDKSLKRERDKTWELRDQLAMVRVMPGKEEELARFLDEENILRQTGLDISNSQVQALLAELAEQRRLNGVIDEESKKREDAKKKSMEAQQALHDFGQALGDATFSFLDQVIFQANSIRDALKNVAQDLARMALQKATSAAFNSIFPAAASANGNVFMGGSITPFSFGGVVSGPTVFPMARGVGLMGEAGPEAVMPLQRMGNGKLGVQSTGGGVTVNLTVGSGANVDEFRRASGALAKRIEGAMRRRAR